MNLKMVDWELIDKRMDRLEYENKSDVDIKKGIE